MEYKLGQEVAEQEFERWAEAMDLDIDPAGMDADDVKAFSDQKRKIVIALMKGALEINERGEAVYTPRNERSKNKDPLTFRERTGASTMAMDRYKKGQELAKTYAIMADMCGVHPSVFAGLVGSDIKVCEALFALLMA